LAGATAATQRPLALHALPDEQSSDVVHVAVQAPAAHRYGAQPCVVPSGATIVTASPHFADAAAGTHAPAVHFDPVAQSSSAAHETAHDSAPPHLYGAHDGVPGEPFASDVHAPSAAAPPAFVHA
jgi:hypothetical protein